MVQPSLWEMDIYFVMNTGLGVFVWIQEQTREGVCTYLHHYLSLVSDIV